jgi:hypothetical protein
MRRGFDFSGLPVVLEGASAHEEIEGISRDWAAFSASPSGTPFLSLGVEEGRQPEDDARAAPKGMRLALDGTAAVYRTRLGSCRVERDGRAVVALAPGDSGARRLALENFVRAAIAFLLPSRGGGAIHAAGVVLDGRAFVLPGASGAGKSTAASLAASQGAIIVSDDLVLVDGASGRPELVGAPFRSTHATESPRGRWPLAAIVFPEKGPEARLDAVPRLFAAARLLSNLTFVADLVGEDPRVGAVVERLVDRVPCAMLTFALDPSFVDLLRRFGS